MNTLEPMAPDAIPGPDAGAINRIDDTQTVPSPGPDAVGDDPDTDPAALAFERVLPRLEREARFQLRNRSPLEFDEARADALAGAWVALVGLRRRGIDPAAVPASGLARNAVRGARAGRKPSCHRRLLAADPFDWRGPLRRSMPDDRDPTALVAADHGDPARIAALRVDLADWLDRLDPGRRRLALLLADGHRTVELARALGLSKGRISQIRRELHRSWLAFHAGAGAGRPAPATVVGDGDGDGDGD